MHKSPLTCVILGQVNEVTWLFKLAVFSVFSFSVFSPKDAKTALHS